MIKLEDTGGRDWHARLAEPARFLIENLYRAFNDDRPELLDEVLVEDWKDHPPGPGQAPGRDGLKAVIPVLRAAFEDLRFEPQDATASAERIAVRLTLRGRHIGEWMGVAASGRAFQIAMHEFHQVENGRIAQTWHVADWASWRDQVSGPA